MSWWEQVPKDPAENLRFRLFLLERAKNNRALQDSILAMCEKDILLYVCVFVWQYNPNSIGTGSPEIGPFIPWDGQEVLFTEIERCIESREDLGIEKSREMGASWGCVLAFLHQFLFKTRKKFIMVSRNEAMVDSPDDPDSLFWKVDFVLAHLPDWMTRGVRRRKLGYINARTRSSITGQATTGKAGVGGRATAMFLDEFALIPDAREIWQRTAGTSNCRIVNSTHDGPGTMFYDLFHDPLMRKYVNHLQMHWSMHPDKAKGLYRYDPVKGKVTILDKSYKFPPGYEFVTNGDPVGGPYPGLRSVWYDQKCGVMGDKRAISIDLDIDAKGSVSQFFDSGKIINLIRTDARDPLWEGILLVDDMGRPERLDPQVKGPIKIWTHLQDNKPPPGPHFIGCDISQGVGTTPSCITVIHGVLREVLMELVTNDVRPEGFARLASAIGWLFKDKSDRGAKIVWESNGPGGHFGRELMNKFGYSNVFYRKSVQELDRGKISESPGWMNTTGTKTGLLTSYRAAIENGDLINRSAESLSECMEFKYEKNKVIHAKEATTEPSQFGGNHGDRVISAALAWMLAREYAGQAIRTESEKTPVGSLAWRRLIAYNADKKREESWM